MNARLERTLLKLDFTITLAVLQTPFNPFLLLTAAAVQDMVSKP